jgi:hypothetical protein
MGNAAPQGGSPIGSSMQDLVSVQGNGVRYLGLLVNAVKAAFIQFGGKTTSATAGAASALPATPAGYVSFTLPDGTIGKFPYYNN